MTLNPDLKIQIDIRERERGIRLKSLLPNSELKTLLVGDVVYGDTVIEIKMPADVISSMRQNDGRLFTQSENMKENYKHCHIIIIGTMLDIIKSQSKHTKYKYSVNAILGALASISERRGINITFIDNLSFAATYMKYLFDKGNDGETKYISPIKRKAATKDEQINVITAYSGISWKRANNLIKHFKTLHAFHNASVKEFENVDKVGKKIALNLYTKIHMEYVENDTKL